MKISETRPSGLVTPVAQKRILPASSGRSVSAELPNVDEATIMDIPESELTPNVHAAIVLLLEEVTKLRSDLERGRERINHLEQLADQDSLVPVANRRAFVREMSRVIAYSQRYHAQSGVLYFDLNGMKEINDTYGHAAGDAALQHLARQLVNNVRESDMVGRLGGDEFGVILAQSDDKAAIEKAESLVAITENNPLIWESKKINLSVAYGSYCFSKNESVDSALQQADKAMYAHKQRGRIS